MKAAIHLYLTGERLSQEEVENGLDEWWALSVNRAYEWLLFELETRPAAIR